MDRDERRLAEIRQRRAAITHLPWETDERDITENVYGGPQNADFIAEVTGDENRRFIAHAPEDITYLLERLEKAERELVELRAWKARLREGQRVRDQRWAEMNPESKAGAYRRYMAAHPEEQRARRRFKWAIKQGWIEKVPSKQFHHVDYTRPYYGVWLTAEEHRRVHADLMECPPCVDYADQVKRIIHETRSRNGRQGNLKRWSGESA